MWAGGLAAARTDRLAGLGGSPQVHRRLVSARRPLVYLGSGAREALADMGDELRAWAERRGIAVVTTVRGKGLFPEHSVAALGVHGLAGSPCAARYLRDGVDALLVVGTRLGEWSSNNFSRDLRAPFVAQVDRDAAAICRSISVDLSIVCDAAAFLTNLLGLDAPDASPDEPGLARVRALARHRAEVGEADAPTSGDASPLRPQQLMAELDRHMRADLDLYVDMGNCTGWATHCLHISPPARISAPAPRPRSEQWRVMWKASGRTGAPLGFGSGSARTLASPGRGRSPA